MNELIARWINGWLDGCIGQMNEWVNGWTGTIIWVSRYLARDVSEKQTSEQGYLVL